MEINFDDRRDKPVHVVYANGGPTVKLRAVRHVYCSAFLAFDR
jgi:hypothetical protein